MPSEHLVLGFDTSAAHCAAALLRGSKVLEHRSEAMAKGQAERLIPMLEEMLAAQGAAWSDLAAVGVGVGPGNFTGIRLSVSAARGLALSLGIPAVGVSTLQAMAYGHDGPVLCALDARRDALYVQTFGLDAPTTATHCTLDTLPWPKASVKAGVMGHRAQELAQKTGGAVAQPVFPLAEAIARLAAEHMDDPALVSPAPLYLKPADAAPSRLVPPTILA